VTVLPIALLLAALYTLTHHARHNEITAMRAAGVSLWRLCVPYLVVGFIASIILFALNEFCVPYSSGWAERIKNRYVQNQTIPTRKINSATSASPTRADIAHGSSASIVPKRPKCSTASELVPDKRLAWELRAAHAVRTNGIGHF